MSIRNTGRSMAEVINLRNARKRARRLEEERRADANRVAHGVSKRTRALEAGKQAKASHDLDGLRIDRGGET